MIFKTIIINEETKQCLSPINQIKAKELGYPELDIEQAYNDEWYLTGYAPAEPEKTYAELRVAEYPSIQEQLDMQYWDSVNGTTNWKDTISAIKEKYPKE